MTNNDSLYGEDPYTDNEVDYEDLVEAKLTTIPDCNFCDKKAEYDFKTKMGPWAYGCKEHYETHSMFSSLGMGKGQKLVQV